MTARDVLGEAIAQALYPSTYDDRDAAWAEAVAVFTDADLDAELVAHARGRAMRADEWTVDPIISHGDAVAIVERLHYSRSASNTSTYRHGLYRAGNDALRELFGAALWQPPTRTAAESVAGEGWRGVLCLSRLVVAPEVPVNGASFLLGRSMKMIDRVRWPVLLTYADTAHGHTGAIYKATNWTSLGPTSAGDVWVGASGRQRGRKRGGRTLTAVEMVDAGFTRLPSLPKIKFVHREAS